MVVAEAGDLVDAHRPIRHSRLSRDGLQSRFQNLASLCQILLSSTLTLSSSPYNQSMHSAFGCIESSSLTSSEPAVSSPPRHISQICSSLRHRKSPNWPFQNERSKLGDVSRHIHRSFYAACRQAFLEHSLRHTYRHHPNRRQTALRRHNHQTKIRSRVTTKA
jgi:hypothetical protein